jgi:hypothetical protein
MDLHFALERQVFVVLLSVVLRLGLLNAVQPSDYLKSA